MDAAGEREVINPGPAGDVEAVRRRVRRRIPIGPREQQHCGLTGGHGDAGHLGGVASRTSRHLYWRVIAEHFFDHRWRSVGILDQHLPLIGVCQQRPDAVADRVDGCLEPGDQQQPAQRAEQGGRDLLVLLGEQRGDDVVAGVRGAPLEEVGEDLPQLALCLQQAA